MFNEVLFFDRTDDARNLAQRQLFLAHCFWFRFTPDSMTTKKTHKAKESPAAYSVPKNRNCSDSGAAEVPILKNESEPFSMRLKNVIGDEPQRSFARRMNISESVMRAYIDGTSKPGMDNLIAIADAGGVTVDWLATGRLPKFRSELGNTPTSHETLNPAMLRMALILTEDSARVQPLSAEQRADMVLAFYHRLTKGDAS